jgi:hypothetical protein
MEDVMNRTSAHRGIWLAHFALTAVVVAVLAGLLAFAGGLSLANAVLTGGAAFAGSMLLLLSIAQFLGGAPK